MKKAFDWADILGKPPYRWSSGEVKFFPHAVMFYRVDCFLGKNNSKMHSWAVIMGTFWPTGMPHRVAQQPTV